MKNLAKASLWLLFTGVMMFAAVGCGEQKKGTSDSQLLVVERQYVDWNDNYKSIGIAIDVPIKGSQPLLDSLKIFLFELQCLPIFYKEDFTKEDDFFTPMFTAEDVQVTEFSDLLTSFADKFKGVDHTGEFRENIFLIAQTESFVTYGIEVFTMGCSGNSSLYLQTFSKADGHRIHHIIDQKDVARFDPYKDLYGTECGSGES